MVTMPDKIEELETLVSQVLANQKALETKNKTLINRVRFLEDTAEKLKQTEAEIKNLREWKKNAQSTLRRLASKIDKEIEKSKQAQDKIG